MAYKWTDEEVALLKAKINTNIKAADIAAQMNIPVREVYEKSSQLRKAGELERVRELKPRSTPPKNAPQAAEAADGQPASAESEEVSKLKKENERLTAELQKAKQNDEKSTERALRISVLNDELKKRDEEKKELTKEIYKYREEVATLKKALEAAQTAAPAGYTDDTLPLDVAELQECVDEIKIGNLLTENQQETLVIMITKILQDMGEATPTLIGPPSIFAKIFRGNGVVTERIIALVEILKMLTDETYYNKGGAKDDEETEEES